MSTNSRGIRLPTLGRLGPVSAMAVAVLLLLIPPSADAGGRQEERLQARDWTAVSVDGQDLIPNSRITLSFSDRAGGSAGCNQYSFDYRTSGGDIAITDLVSTTMACDDSDLMEQESEYLRVLNEVERYEINNGELTLSGTGGSTVRFVPAPEVADASLTETTWMVEGIIDGDIARSLYTGNEITVRFEGDRIVIESESECEEISAPFSLDGGRIVAGGLPVQPNCVTSDFEEDLSAVLTTLRSQPTYTLEGSALRFEGPDQAAIDLRAR